MTEGKGSKLLRSHSIIRKDTVSKVLQGRAQYESDKTHCIDLLLRVQGFSEHFRGFDQEDIVELIDQVSVVSLKPSSTVVEEGEEATFAAIILDGAVQVFKGNNLVEQLRPGDCFGEQAVFEVGKRNATLKAANKTVMLAIVTMENCQCLRPEFAVRLLRCLLDSSVQKLHSFLQNKSDTRENWMGKMQEKNIKAEVMMPLLQNIQDSIGLRDLDEDELKIVASKADLVSFAKGEQIFYQGQRAKHILIVLKGQVEAIQNVFNSKDNAQEKKVFPMKKNGEVLGEIAFFLSRERTADVIATTDVSCAAISAQQLADINFYHSELGVKLLINFGTAGIQKLTAAAGAASVVLAHVNEEESDKMARAKEKEMKSAKKVMSKWNMAGRLAKGAAQKGLEATNAIEDNLKSKNAEIQKLKNELMDKSHKIISERMLREGMEKQYMQLATQQNEVNDKYKEYDRKLAEAENRRMVAEQKLLQMASAMGSGGADAVGALESESFQGPPKSRSFTQGKSGERSGTSSPSAGETGERQSEDGAQRIETSQVMMKELQKLVDDATKIAYKAEGEIATLEQKVQKGLKPETAAPRRKSAVVPSVYDLPSTTGATVMQFLRKHVIDVTTKTAEQASKAQKGMDMLLPELHELKVVAIQKKSQSEELTALTEAMAKLKKDLMATQAECETLITSHDADVAQIEQLKRDLEKAEETARKEREESKRRIQHLEGELMTERVEYQNLILLSKAKEGQLQAALSESVENGRRNLVHAWWMSFAHSLAVKHAKLNQSKNLIGHIRLEDMARLKLQEKQVEERKWAHQAAQSAAQENKNKIHTINKKHEVELARAKQGTDEVRQMLLAANEAAAVAADASRKKLGLVEKQLGLKDKVIAEMRAEQAIIQDQENSAWERISEASNWLVNLSTMSSWLLHRISELEESFGSIMRPWSKDEVMLMKSCWTLMEQMPDNLARLTSRTFPEHPPAHDFANPSTQVQSAGVVGSGPLFEAVPEVASLPEARGPPARAASARPANHLGVKLPHEIPSVGVGSMDRPPYDPEGPREETSGDYSIRPATAPRSRNGYGDTPPRSPSSREGMGASPMASRGYNARGAFQYNSWSYGDGMPPSLGRGLATQKKTQKKIAGGGFYSPPVPTAQNGLRPSSALQAYPGSQGEIVPQADRVLVLGADYKYRDITLRDVAQGADLMVKNKGSKARQLKGINTVQRPV